MPSFIWNYYKNQLLKHHPQPPPLTTGALVFIVTAKCNFRCAHCLRNFNNTGDLPLDIAQKVLVGAKKYNYKNIYLTGGEPLVYPYLIPLIEMIVAQGYKFAIVTNGYNFKQSLDIFKKYQRHITHIAFSLESTNLKKHDAQRQEGSFEKLMEDFRLCQEHHISFRIVTTISTRNYDELFDIVLFAKKKRAQSITMTTVLPCPRSEENNFVLDAQKRKELLLALLELPKILKFPILIGADIRANSNPNLCHAMMMLEVAIDMDGNLVQCCELGNFDSDVIHREAIVTSLKDKSFDDGLKILSEYMHQFRCKRIDDYQRQKDVTHIDFNSCFYCIHKLSSA